MNKYVVPEEFLDIYKEFADRYSSHDKNCGANINNYYYNGSDDCDCGFSEKVNKLKYLQKEIFKCKGN